PHHLRLPRLQHHHHLPHHLRHPSVSPRHPQQQNLRPSRSIPLEAHPQQPLRNRPRQNSIRLPPLLHPPRRFTGNLHHRQSPHPRPRLVQGSSSRRSSRSSFRFSRRPRTSRLDQHL